MLMMPFAFSLKSETGSLLVTDEKAPLRIRGSKEAEQILCLMYSYFLEHGKAKMNWCLREFN